MAALLPRWRKPAPGASTGSSREALEWPVAVYSASRLLVLAVAAAVGLATHHPIASELFRYDGQWFLRLAEHGYPAAPLHTQSTLGFFPLYALVIRGVAWACSAAVPQAALVISTVGGMVSAVLVQRLATAWWGQDAARRATVAWCLFPGTIVFSMAYSECLTVPLALGCLLALRSRRWWAAGLLAGIATAVEPVAIVLAVICLIAAARQVRAHGWRDPAARRSLLAPLLAPLGIGGFAVFLWVWTGTPFATYIAQHYGWHQQSEPLAFLTLPIVQHTVAHAAQVAADLLTWNVWNGVLGGAFLWCSIAALVRGRRELSTGALALAIGIGAVTLWSVMTPPNARIVLVAFPAVMVWGRRLPGRWFGVFAAVETLVLVLMCTLTFSGHMLP